MNGTAHTAIGAATGFMIANRFDSEPSVTLLLVGLGAVSGLMPSATTRWLPCVVWLRRFIPSPVA